jgi:hypothetical protein
MSISHRLLSLVNRSKETKELFHPRNFKRLVDALIYADQPKAAPIFLPRDIGPNERSDACRIRQWNRAEVENQPARVVGAHPGLKAEYVGKRQRSRQAKYADSLPRPGKIFDVQGLIWH